MSDFINVPESDFRLDEPDIHPLVVTLMFDEPREKEYPSQHGGGTFKTYYYTIENEGTEFALGASAALHKKIQGVNAVKGTVIKILKKRIGDDNKDIRWSVAYVSGPVGQARAQAVTPTATTPASKPASNVEYVPLTDTGLGVWILDQQDQAALFSVSLAEAKKVWAGAGIEADPRSLQATAASLFIQGTRSTNGVKGLNKMELPPEPDPIADIVAGIDHDDLPDSFFDAVGANTDFFEDGDGIKSAMKALGRTGIPKGFHNQYEAVRDLLRFAEFRESGMEVVDAVDAVIEAQENEPAF